MTRIGELIPKWEAFMPSLISVLETGTEDGRVLARAELMRLARAMDDRREPAPENRAAGPVRERRHVWGR